MKYRIGNFNGVLSYSKEVSIYLSSFAVLFSVILILINIYPAQAVGMTTQAQEENAKPFYQGEITVTATRYPQLTGQIPAAVSVIDQRELHYGLGGQLSDFLRLTPAADVKTYGQAGQASSVRLRGSNANQVLYLLDGQPINSPTFGNFDMVDIPLPEVARVEILRGPFSSLYGANAVGGVVNIITGNKQPSYFSCRRGSYNQQEYLINYQSGDLGLIGGKKEAGVIRGNDTFFSQYLSGNCYLPSGDGSGWRLGFNYYTADKGIPGPTFAPSPEAKQIDGRDYYWMAYEKDKSRVSLYFKRNRQYFSDPNPVFPTDSKLAEETINVDWTDQTQVEDHLLTWGLNWQKVNFNSSDIGFNQGQYLGGMVQDQMTWPGDINFVVNTRLDKMPRSGAISNTRVGLNFPVIANWRGKAAWGQAYRPPSLADLYWPDQPFMIGNPDLKAETSSGWDVGLEGKISAIGDQEGVLSLTYFSQSIGNMIVWTPNDVWKFQPQNISGVKNTGIEAEIKYPWPGGEGFANFTWQRSTDEQTGQAIIYSPSQKANFGFRLDVPFFGTPCTAGANLSYVGTRYTLPDDSQTLPSYTTADAFYQFDWESSKFNFQVKNILDSSYEEQYGYPMPGRRWLVSWEYNF